MFRPLVAAAATFLVAVSVIVSVPEGAPSETPAKAPEHPTVQQTTVKPREETTQKVAHPAPAPSPKPAPPKYPDNIDGWVSESLDVLRAHDVPVGPRAHERLKRVAWHESSFRPHVVNTWDSNAAKGIPSIGLMQTIEPTFEAHKLPGYDDIRDPVDNTIAATRYMFDRYGSIEEHPGIESLEAGGDYKPY